MFNQKNFYEYRNNNVKGYVVSSIVYIFLLLLLLNGCSSSTNKVQIEPIGAPKLVLEESSYDFGDIKPNSTNTEVFHYTNVGDQPLILKDAFKCCGAVVTLDKEELAPGQSGTLTATYSVGSTPTTFTRNVGFYTNDPENEQVVFTIKGQVIETLTWTPESFEMADYDTDVACPAITIKSLDGTPFSIKGFTSTSQCFLADYDPDSSATEFTIEPTANIDGIKQLQTLSQSGTVLIELNHPDYKTVTLNFKLIPSLQAEPAQVLAFNVIAGNPVQRSIEIQDSTADSVRDIADQIDSVVSQSGAKVDILKSSCTNTGCKLDLELMLAESEGSESFSRDELVVKMKDGRELTVPIRIFYQSQTLTSKAD